MTKLVLGGLSVSTSTSISTAEAVKAFVTSRRVKGVTQRTLEGYHYLFKPFILKYPTLPLTPEPIEEFLDSLKIDIESRWSYDRNLHALYLFLEKRRGIPNPMRQMERIKIPRKVRRVLSLEEMRRLFTFTQNFQETAILTLLMDSKIRASELCSLTRERVYPDHITVTGKTGERDVPIKPETYDMLCQLAPSGLLFRVNGRRLRREYLRIILHRLMVRSGLNGEKLGPHILRHSTSVQHMMHGGDLLSLKEELGHTTTVHTEKYARLAFPQVKQRHAEVDVLGKIVKQSVLERAICYGCNHQIVVEYEKVKATKCPGCGQVGKWYLPNHRGGGEA